LHRLENPLKNKVVQLYCLVFYVLAAYKLINGLWLFQLTPQLFVTRYDGFTWLFMKTGIHQWLLNNPTGWALADTLFYTMPLLYFLANNIYKTGGRFFAILMLVVNWLYVQCYTLYPTNSIESHIVWLLFPVIFLAAQPHTFRLLMHGLRYFFLFFFASAGIWKIINGGVFYSGQMTGVLLYQHADILNSTPEYWQSRFIQWIINHPAWGYALYIAATVMELVFVIGFFTRKFDRTLIVLFLLFLVFDHLVMRIPYYEAMPFLLTLRFTQWEKEKLQ